MIMGFRKKNKSRSPPLLLQIAALAVRPSVISPSLRHFSVVSSSSRPLVSLVPCFNIFRKSKGRSRRIAPAVRPSVISPSLRHFSPLVPKSLSLYVIPLSSPHPSFLPFRLKKAKLEWGGRENLLEQIRMRAGTYQRY